eukprot:GHVP01052246.1.p1 GENE.GHVP01052246.1~~GHVP01052246.1.p1  ORF type:complete len:239 (+),score=42.90 GHVP01052246.1:44-760(+)
MHFDLIKKTSEELNAAALQTNIGDNLFKENLPCEDWKVEDLRFYGKFGKPSRQNESSSQDDSTGWEATNFAFAHDEGTTPFLKSQIEEIKENIRVCCRGIFEQVSGKLDLGTLKGYSHNFNFREKEGRIGNFYFIWYDATDVHFPKDKEIQRHIWIGLADEVRKMDPNSPFISLPFFLDREGKFSVADGSGTKINSFCILWDKLQQDSHQTLKALLEKLKSNLDTKNEYTKKLKKFDH